MEKPIFIVGTGRSGTTLLRMMLNSHSKIAISPETHFFRLFWSNRHKYGKDLDDEDNFKKLWNDLTNCKYFKDLKFEDPQRIYKELLSEKRSYKSIFEKLLKEYSIQHNKLRWGEKTPVHLVYIETILAFFPYAKIIHIIRDPRDVALSYKKVPWGKNDVFSVARLWNKYMEIPKRCKRVNNSNFLEIKYEDLVKKPKEILKIICSFIEEDFEEQMLNFHVYSKQYMVQNEPWKEGVLKPLSTANIGKWKKELSKWEIEQIEIKCRRNMVEKGYLKGSLDLSFNEILVLHSKNVLFHSLWFFRASFRKITRLIKIRPCIKVV